VYRRVVVLQRSLQRSTSLCPRYAPALVSTIVLLIIESNSDQPKCLKIPGIGPVARGFQDHHDFPIESTAGKGLRVLFNDTVRIQWITLVFSALISSKRDYNTMVMILLKWVTCAYGTQVIIFPQPICRPSRSIVYEVVLLCFSAPGWPLLRALHSLGACAY
jgi:hypothetical protein